MVTDLGEAREGLVGLHCAVEDVLDEPVETSDRIEVDDRGSDPQRVAPLMGNGPYRDLDDRRRGGDLGPGQAQRARERQDALLVVGSRIPRVVSGTREPEEELCLRAARAPSDVLRVVLPH